jgi:hypothetical protein
VQLFTVYRLLEPQCQVVPSRGPREGSVRFRTGTEYERKLDGQVDRPATQVYFTVLQNISGRVLPVEYEL